MTASSAPTVPSQGVRVTGQYEITVVDDGVRLSNIEVELVFDTHDCYTVQVRLTQYPHIQGFFTRQELTQGLEDGFIRLYLPNQTYELCFNLDDLFDFLWQTYAVILPGEEDWLTPFTCLPEDWLVSSH